MLVRCALLRAQLDEQLLQALLRVGHERHRLEDGELVRHLILRQHLCERAQNRLPDSNYQFTIQSIHILYCTSIFDMHSKVEMRRLKDLCFTLRKCSSRSRSFAIEAY